MSKLTQQLTALRESLRDADGSQPDSFSEVFSEFLAITETTELIDVCKPYHDKTTRMMLEQIFRKHANDPKHPAPQAQMQRHPASGLVHGMIAAGRHIGTFFYLPDEQQGIVAFGGLTPTMHYYRITATEVPFGSVIGRKGRGSDGLLGGHTSVTTTRNAARDVSAVLLVSPWFSSCLANILHRMIALSKRGAPDS